MIYKILISPVAKNDIRNAVDFYKTRASVKVAAGFIHDYKQALKHIRSNPFFRVYYKTFRGLPLKKYPYIIFYQVDEKNKLILVNAIFQANQSTDKRPI